MQATLRIDSGRMRADFEALSEIGDTGDGGVHRPTFSESHLAARNWFLEVARRSGFDTQVDSAGNHSARLAMPAATRTLLLGSHLDSVPHGGRFDGGLGVVAALEALRSIQEAGLKLPVHLEAIDFTDEEGTLVGMLGSSAVAGTLEPQHLETPRGGRDNLLSGLARAGLSEDGLFDARREPEELAGYLELHIEQGPRLAKAQIDVGIVTGIVGIASFEVVFYGKSNHAGTTPMEGRSDASLGASAFILAAHDLVRQKHPASFINFGRAEFEPGAYNIIPGRARLALEFRAPDQSEFSRLEKNLTQEANQAADRFGLRVDMLPKAKWSPVEMNEDFQDSFERAANNLSLSHVRLNSGAGHDAEKLVHATPAAMFFIPSPNGISHDPQEYSTWTDCENGANVLLNAAIDVASGGAPRD